MNQHLHIIALNIPDPPDYGGMIDTFYRVESLSNMGVKIHLHCFQYGRPHSTLLESICETVNYYPRNYDALVHLSTLPYIVSSRKSKILLNNLKRDNYPILFDGLHTTYYLNNPDLAHRRKLVRVHNAEHQYYLNLAKTETNLIKKLFFYIESYKLKSYENTLGSADFLLSISENDHNYFNLKFSNSLFLPPFHPFSESVSLEGFGEYGIFHGNLSVKDNELTAISLIENIFSKLPYSFVIAGKNPPPKLQHIASLFSNIRIVANPDSKEMLELIRNAHIQILKSKSSDGFKMKILYALFAGRHCIVSSEMIKQIAGKELFNIADSNEELKNRIHLLMHEGFTKEIINERMKILNQHYNNELGAKLLTAIAFDEVA